LRDSLQRFQPLGEFRFARHTDPLAHFRSLTKPPTRCVQKISLEFQKLLTTKDREKRYCYYTRVKIRGLFCGIGRFETLFDVF
jgi:hypothetical protein